jgi:hypothetical protein
LPLGSSFERHFRNAVKRKLCLISCGLLQLSLRNYQGSKEIINSI